MQLKITKCRRYKIRPYTFIMIFVDYISAPGTTAIRWNVIGYCFVSFYGDKLGSITKITNKMNIETSKRLTIA